MRTEHLTGKYSLQPNIIVNNDLYWIIYEPNIILFFAEDTNLVISTRS